MYCRLKLNFNQTLKTGQSICSWTKNIFKTQKRLQFMIECIEEIPNLWAIVLLDSTAKVMKSALAYFLTDVFDLIVLHSYFPGEE